MYEKDEQYGTVEAEFEKHGRKIKKVGE